MTVWSDLKDWSQSLQQNPALRRVSMTIGNFDGVHRGHQELIRHVLRAGGCSDCFPLLLTFQPHPVQVLAPDKKHTRLFHLQDQQEELARYGIRGIFRQAFSRQFSEMPAEEFLQDYILKFFHPRHIVVGQDFSFGAGKQGRERMLREFCNEHRIGLDVVPPYSLAEGGARVSTSAIRQALSDGDLETARKMLGRRYYLQGIVEKGDGRGRTLGFATANIRPDVDFYPRTGVYVCQVEIGAEVRRAVMNVGLNKTFVEGDHHPIKVEAHVLDFGADLYGRTLKVELCHYLREEKKFSSIEELKTQIGKDVVAAKEWKE
ncbi:MAG: bifunctional riboflavin kinase/FAD synthetase [Bdellovibrio sp. CG10_big_fil_rev_8_21_14_0_10_47_8]|nr:MAG: bifunctional riboflavin kinase/FAD synthetase [Bdellovibrio sp. CG10_big_fil_rev_8_21_14_0_10_47_8]